MHDKFREILYHYSIPEMAIAPLKLGFRGNEHGSFYFYLENSRFVACTGIEPLSSNVFQKTEKPAKCRLFL
jgi:hypothetical protein